MKNRDFLKIIKGLLMLLILSGAFVWVGFLYCNNNFQFWTHLKTDNFETLTEYRGENIAALKGRQILVNKSFKNHLDTINEYAQQSNIKVIINQSYRHKNRKPSRAVVAPGKYSNHLAGYAIDFNIKHNGIKYFSNDLKRNNLSELPINIQNFIRKIRQNKDLRWGGDFKKEDPIHIDCPINLKNKKDWDEYSRLCDNDYSKGIPKWKIWMK